MQVVIKEVKTKNKTRQQYPLETSYLIIQTELCHLLVYFIQQMSVYAEKMREIFSGV